MVRRSNTADATHASITARALAMGLDLLVLTVGTVVVLGITFSVAPRALWAVGMVAGVGNLLYFVLLEGVTGQTLGKRVMGISVVSTAGGRAGLTSAILRNVFRAFDSLPTAYLLGIAVIYVSANDQRIGDLVGNTAVVATH